MKKCISTSAEKESLSASAAAVDSAVMAALAVQALGKQKVIGFILPEKESNPLSAHYAAKHAETGN